MSSTNTTIEWTEKTWNPVRGCSLVSPGMGGDPMKRAARVIAGAALLYGVLLVTAVVVGSRSAQRTGKGQSR